MTRTRTVLVLGALAAALPLAAYAGGFGGRGSHHGPRAESAEEAREHAGRMADRVLDRVDATDAQRDQIDAVLDEAVPRLYAVHQDGRDLREEGRELLVAETVDAQAVEGVRKDAVALFDEGSKVMADAMVRIGNVLTVEQRRDLADAMERFRDERGGRGPDEGPGDARGRGR